MHGWIIDDLANFHGRDISAIDDHESVLFGEIYIAHAQKLLFPNLWSKHDIVRA